MGAGRRGGVAGDVVPDVPTDTVGDCRDCEFRKQTHGATDAIMAHTWAAREDRSLHVVDVYEVETEPHVGS